MFTADMKPLLRQCDVGEIVCNTCVGREVCERYPMITVEKFES